MDILNIPGAATNGVGVGAMATAACKWWGFRPDIITGVSYGAIIALPLAFGMFEDIKEKSSSITSQEIFKFAPLNKKGKIKLGAAMRAFWSLISKKGPSFGVQDIKPLLKEFISEETFNIYKTSTLPEVYIVAVKVSTGSPCSFRVKDLCYKKYLQVVSASSRIPVWTQPEEIEGEQYFDGGITEVNAGNFVLEQLGLDPSQINKVVSIYPRPKMFKGVEFEPKEIKTILQAINWTIAASTRTVSKDDETQERLLFSSHPKKLIQLFLPYKLPLYETNKKQLIKLWAASTLAAKKELSKHPTQWKK